MSFIEFYTWCFGGTFTALLFLFVATSNDPLHHLRGLLAACLMMALFWPLTWVMVVLVTIEVIREDY